MPKLTRWKIEGLLKTRSPLHVGDGGVRKGPEDLETVEVATISKAWDGVAYIPGSSLKGSLRSWLEERGLGGPGLTKVFGARDATEGGKAEFHDAFFDLDNAENPKARTQHFCEKSKTCIGVGVTIDRRTRTALDEHLFHAEYVPTNIQFAVSIGFRDIEEGEVPDEVALVLAALAAFEQGDGVRLGAGTNDGFGEMEWTPTKVYRAGAVQEWLRGDCKDPWKDVTQGPLVTQGLQLLAQAKSPERYRIGLRLRFESNFLVSDPRSAKHTKREDANHAPILMDGKIALPGSSLRGAFRNQAERILRTMAGGEGPNCPGWDPTAETKAIRSAEEAAAMPLISRIFGASGWASPIWFSAFRPLENVGRSCGAMRQEFVAVDRFTGGGRTGRSMRLKVTIGPFSREL